MAISRVFGVYGSHMGVVFSRGAEGIDPGGLVIMPDRILVRTVAGLPVGTAVETVTGERGVIRAIRNSDVAVSWDGGGSSVFPASHGLYVTPTEVIAQWQDGAGAWTVTREGDTLTVATPNDETLTFTLTRAPECDSLLAPEFAITDRYASCDDWGYNGVVWIDGEGFTLEGGDDARQATGCYCPSDCACHNAQRVTVCGCTGTHD